MSSFYDIWIGAAPPVYKRSQNKDWQSLHESIWQSLPMEDKGFLHTASNDGYQLVFIGQLYERLEMSAVLKRCIDYIAKPDTVFEAPAGHYMIFVQSSKKESFVFTNRLGSYHAYWSDEGVISTCYMAMAKQRTQKKIDWQGVTGFMAMGYFPNDTTYLQGIHIFEPASYYRFDSSLQLKEKRKYKDWQYEPQAASDENYTERLQDVLRSSLSVAVENKVTAIPISGGLDSRMLAGELPTCGSESLQGLSYGFTEDSPEIKIAQQVAAQKNIPLHSYTMPNYLFDSLDEITEAVELFQYVDGTRQASATNWLSKNADVVVGGHWGDVWMDSMGIEKEEELPTAFRKKIIKKGAAWLLDKVCVPNLPATDEYLNDYFSSFMNKYSDIKYADFKMKIYKTEQWSFRWTAASMRMYQYATMPVLPFYDSRIVDVFCAIPTEAVRDRKLQIAYLKKYHKDLAKITWQEYDANLYSYKYFNNRNIAYRAVKKAQRTLSGSKTIQRNWEVFYLNPAGRKNLEQKLLHNKQLTAIVPKEKIKILLDDLQANPTAANGYTVSMLLTFSLFLDKVFS